MPQQTTEFSTLPLDRIRCAYFPLCSGCYLQEHVSSPPVWQDVQRFFHSIGREISLKQGALTGWRTRSKLAVRGSYLEPQIGLFKRGTHEVVAIPECPLHHLAINQAYQKVYHKIKEEKLVPYDEEKGTGLIRYLQFAVERKSCNVQLTFILNREGRDPLVEKCVKRLYRIGGFQAIWINFQQGSTNRILGDVWCLVEGEPYIWEKVDQADVCFHPACFAQAHLELFEEMVRSIRSSLLPNKRVVEFYAGVGVIGLNLVEKSAHILCTEVNPFAEECFLLSRLKLPLDLQSKIDFIPGDVKTVLSCVENAEIILVDPPRKGLDPELLHRLCTAQSLEQLFYVSCGFCSFQSDCEKLLQHGWKIEKAEGYLFFPGSNHVEILCLFTRLK